MRMMDAKIVGQFYKLCTRFTVIGHSANVKVCRAFLSRRHLSRHGYGTLSSKGGNFSSKFEDFTYVLEQISRRSNHRHSFCGRTETFAEQKTVFTVLSCNRLKHLGQNSGDTGSYLTPANLPNTRSNSNTSGSGNVKEKIHQNAEQGDNEIRENICTIPNLLTMSRIALTPVIGYLVVKETFGWALGLFVIAGITDLLDGYIARNFKNQTSALGTALDPLADKILMTILTLSVTSAGLLPVSLAMLIVGRDVLLVAAAFYIRFISLTHPRTIKRYFDVTIPTAELHPSTISKINTALQLSLVSLTLAAPVFDFIDHPALQALWVVTGLTTLASGISYIVTRNSNVKFLRKEMQRKF